MLKILSVLVGIVGVVDFTAAIVGGIWLAIAGDWWAIGYGILALVASQFAVSILLLPAIAIGTGGAALADSGRTGAARLVLGASSLYTAALMGAWSLVVTSFFLGHARHASLFPMLLWAYAASTGPWAFLAAKDQQGGNEYSALGVLFLEVGYIVGGILFLATHEATLFIAAISIALTCLWVLQQVMARDLATSV